MHGNEYLLCCVVPLIIIGLIYTINLISNDKKKPINSKKGLPKIIIAEEVRAKEGILVKRSEKDIVETTISAQNASKDTDKASIGNQMKGDIEVNKEFQYVLDAIEEKSKNAFITGKAGTGKSTLLRYFVENTKKRTVVLALTGLAAINVEGSTIHKFFHFPIKPLSKDEIREVQNKDLYQNLDCIVIDEISMVRADMLDNIDQFLRINGNYPSLPFGGIQMVIFGDPYQLAPIVSSEAEANLLGRTYESPWFFDAECFRSNPFEVFELYKVYRQTDKNFIVLLDKIRKGRETSTDLFQINSCVNQKIDQSKRPIYLTTTNAIANRKNYQKLVKLPSEERVFLGEIEGKFSLRHTLPTLMELKLKEGAQVMFVKNDTNKRWVNGTIGKIQRIDNEEISVEIKKNKQFFTVQVGPVIWENRKYIYDYLENKINSEVIGTFTQYPLKLAWAITIHKSQGLTFQNVIIDMGRGAFSNGQTYVALSRCTSLEGISLVNPISKSDVKVDFHMRNWMRKRITKSIDFE